MSQIDIEFQDKPKCVYPNEGTQHQTLLRAFARGERLTVAKALTQYGVYALSQRVGDLKKMGWSIKSRTIKTPTIRNLCEYWMEL